MDLAQLYLSIRVLSFSLFLRPWSEYWRIFWREKKKKKVGGGGGGSSQENGPLADKGQDRESKKTWRRNKRE